MPSAFEEARPRCEMPAGICMAAGSPMPATKGGCMQHPRHRLGDLHPHSPPLPPPPKSAPLTSP
jgi:hypothetical protein